MKRVTAFVALTLALWGLGAKGAWARVKDAPAALVRVAKAQIGVRYHWGGTSRRGFDCSGLTQYVYRKALGLRLPRTASAQFRAGRKVPGKGIQPGDLVFFRERGRVGHCGIYLGRGIFLHAPHTGARVRPQRLIGWYARRLAGARRYARV